MNTVLVVVDDYPFQADSIFPYSVPSDIGDKIQFGSLVYVPFGLHNQPRLAFVTGIRENEATFSEILKPVYQLVSNKTISKKQYRIILAIAKLYQLPLSKLLSWCGLFPKHSQPASYYVPIVETADSLMGFRNQKALFNYLIKHKEGFEPVLFRKRFHLKKTTTILKKLENSGLIEKKIRFIPPQVREDRQGIDSRECHFVNHSTLEGRINAYLQLIKDSNAKEVLLILPNTQSQAETKRLIEKNRVTANIQFGSKQDSLKFTRQCDMMIIENSSSLDYQIEQPFSFHHEKVAYIRSRIEGFHLVIGSYIPSLFCYQKLQSGVMKTTHTQVTVQWENPKIVIRSMNQEIIKHGFHLLPFSLQSEIDLVRQSGKKTLLLLNRKGYANILHCQNCSSLQLCQHCGSPLSLLSDRKTTRCKNCGFLSPYQPICRSCGQNSVRFGSFGTEKLEEEARNRFPYLQIVRIDKNQSYLTDDEISRSDLIIGTTLTLNRVNWHLVDFCCLIGIDARMNFPVYHSQADIFFLFAQLSEKLTASKEIRKKILVFSFTPFAEIFQWLIPSKHSLFYENEFATRKELSYPPYVHVMEWKITAAMPDELENEIAGLHVFFNELPGNVEVTFSRMEKKSDNLYQCRIHFKTSDLWNLSPHFCVKIDELKKNEKIVLDVKKWEW